MMNKKGLTVSSMKSLVVGIILLLVLISVYTTNAANFTGLTGTVMSFVTIGAAIGLFIKSFSK